MDIRILLAEEVRLFRGALAALLGLEADFHIVASVSRMKDVVPAALESQPHVAVLDIDARGQDGLTVAKELHEKMPSCRALAFSSCGSPALIQRALAAHVSGFLLKDAPSSQLAKSVRAVAAGQHAIDPNLMMGAWRSETSPLSVRETEVLWQTAQGATIGEIAASLCLSKGTVSNYLTAIVCKLGARNRIDAVRIAFNEDWLR